MAHTTPKIRPAASADLDRVHDIAVAGWIPIFERYRLIVGDRMWNDIWKGWEENWFPPTAERHNDRMIVAEVNGHVAGFATWWFHSNEFAEVGGNAVHPEFQGRGIGTAQMQWVVNMFRQKGYTCAKVHTGMDPAHGPARAEYRKAGLRRPVLNSVYLNYLSEVARIRVPSSLSFRWASGDDREFIAQTIQDVWSPIFESIRTSVGENIFDIVFSNAIEDKKNEFLKTLDESREGIRIVSEYGQSAGFAVVKDEPAKKVGEIAAIAVAPEFQGRGIGAGLCMDTFDIFRERGLAYARLKASLGEVTWQMRQLCWNVGLYRELPSIDYYMML
ncbi:MAG: GNAT family N-acetyltransferase [Planctomycetes bacterium]|nr:GNAT family N-acetyltransferase [Planctomycetota bacterium]